MSSLDHMLQPHKLLAFLIKMRIMTFIDLVYCCCADHFALVATMSIQPSLVTQIKK